MKTLLVLSTFLLMTSASFAESECQGEMVVASYNCINLKPGLDVRLNIMEFQTCEEGKITELTRNVTVMKFGGDLAEPSPEIIDVVYSPERVLYEPTERVDHLTFLYPVSLKAQDGKNTIVMNMTNKLQPIFKGSYDKHMPATLEYFNESGALLKKGNLSCTLFR
jgi:hypothetical protein